MTAVIMFEERKWKTVRKMRETRERELWLALRKRKREREWKSRERHTEIRRRQEREDMNWNKKEKIQERRNTEQRKSECLREIEKKLVALKGFARKESLRGDEAEKLQILVKGEGCERGWKRKIEIERDRQREREKERERLIKMLRKTDRGRERKIKRERKKIKRERKRMFMELYFLQNEQLFDLKEYQSVMSAEVASSAYFLFLNIIWPSTSRATFIAKKQTNTIPSLT